MSTASPIQAAASQPRALVSGVVAHALLETAERSRIPRARLLAAAKLSCQTWPDDGRRSLPRSDVYRLFETALELSNDPGLGLRWGDSLPDRELNVVSQLVKHAPTLGQAFQSLFRFSRLLSSESGIRLRERHDCSVVQCVVPKGVPLTLQRLLSEMTLGGIYRLIRHYEPNARPLRVSFAYPAPVYRAQYTEVFDGAERFDDDVTELAFDTALMDAVSVRADPDLVGALRPLAERRLMDMVACTPCSVRVSDVLRRCPHPGRLAMKDVARELQISESTLRRRLSDEGTDFAKVAGRAVVAAAARLLIDERRSIQEAAFAMGYDNVSSFHRAFKHWTGQTPGTFLGRAR